MIGSNPAIWKVSPSISGMVAELLPSANPEKPVISLGPGDPAAYPHLFSKGREAFTEAVASAVTSTLYDAYPPPFGFPSARR
ncbi:hypothetical protein KSP40_PGU010925 [Platanthera guangdongensis]|uniref:Uncharacterized protein n=1 Tax=Platanthera guangdongensis TaxID=2320717 RepID=A0ABR2LH15_9ASPA